MAAKLGQGDPVTYVLLLLLKRSLFQVVRHGFPYKPTCMALDTVQGLLAIATQESSVVISYYSKMYLNVGRMATKT